MCFVYQTDKLFCDLTALTNYDNYQSCFKLHTLENMLLLKTKSYTFG